VHTANEATGFDMRMAELLSADGGGGGGSSSVSAATVMDRALDTMVERPEWEEAWHAAETADLLRRVDSVMDAEGAWMNVEDVEWLDELGDEFSPPNCAVGMVSLLRLSLLRCEGLSIASVRVRYLQAVSGAVVRCVSPSPSVWTHSPDPPTSLDRLGGRVA
jgi:hypothetical protein